MNSTQRTLVRPDFPCCETLEGGPSKQWRDLARKRLLIDAQGTPGDLLVVHLLDSGFRSPWSSEPWAPFKAFDLELGCHPRTVSRRLANLDRLGLLTRRADSEGHPWLARSFPEGRESAQVEVDLWHKSNRCYWIEGARVVPWVVPEAVANSRRETAQRRAAVGAPVFTPGLHTGAPW